MWWTAHSPVWDRGSVNSHGSPETCNYGNHKLQISLQPHYTYLPSGFYRRITLRAALSANIQDTDQVWTAPDGKQFHITISFIEAVSLLLKDLKRQDIYDAGPRQLLEVETILMSCPNWIYATAGTRGVDIRRVFHYASKLKSDSINIQYRRTLNKINPGSYFIWGGGHL